jgi:hypothetical protein
MAPNEAILMAPNEAMLSPRSQFDDQTSDNSSCSEHDRACFILWFLANLNLLCVVPAYSVDEIWMICSPLRPPFVPNVQLQSLLPNFDPQSRCSTVPLLVLLVPWRGADFSSMLEMSTSDEQYMRVKMGS